jgi:hypothetical protein
MKTFSSFSVKSPLEISHQASHPIGGHRMFGANSTPFTVNLMSSQPKLAVQKRRRGPFSF